MDWISLNVKAPSESSYYEVKATGPYAYIRGAYYDSHTDAWLYDDGSCLLADVSRYVTHWHG